MTNSTFKPTHVRCVRYDYMDDYITVGQTYKIINTYGSDGIEIEANRAGQGFSRSFCVTPTELKIHTIAHCKFRYVGPPAILGNPVND